MQPRAASTVNGLDRVAPASHANLSGLAGDGEREHRPPLLGAGPQSSVPFPNGWILDGGLKLYRSDPAHAGRSTAALKLILTLTLLAGTASRAHASEPGGSVLASYEQISAIAGLSRPLIASARKMLCGQGLVRVSYEGQGGRVRYHLDDLASAKGRIHHALRPGCGDALVLSCLRSLPCREVRSLHALKLYVLMSGLRDDGRPAGLISRAEIATFTNLRESQIAAAFSTLRRHRLIAADARAVRTRDQWEPFPVTLHPLS